MRKEGKNASELNRLKLKTSYETIKQLIIFVWKKELSSKKIYIFYTLMEVMFNKMENLQTRQKYFP